MTGKGITYLLFRGNGQCGHCPSRRGGTHRGRAAGARKQLAAVGQGARLGHEASPRTYTVCTTTRVTLRLSKACAPSMLASAYCRPAGGIRRVGVITKSTKAQAQPTARRQSGTRLWRLPFARVPRASVRSIRAKENDREAPFLSKEIEKLREKQ